MGRRGIGFGGSFWGSSFQGAGMSGNDFGGEGEDLVTEGVVGEPEGQDFHRQSVEGGLNVIMKATLLSDMKRTPHRVVCVMVESRTG